MLDAGRADYNTNRPHSRLGWMSPAFYAAGQSAALRYRDGSAPRTAVTTARRWISLRGQRQPGPQLVALGELEFPRIRGYPVGTPVTQSR